MICRTIRSRELSWHTHYVMTYAVSYVSVHEFPTAHRSGSSRDAIHPYRWDAFSQAQLSEHNIIFFSSTRIVRTCRHHNTDKGGSVGPPWLDFRHLVAWPIRPRPRPRLVQALPVEPKQRPHVLIYDVPPLVSAASTLRRFRRGHRAGNAHLGRHVSPTLILDDEGIRLPF